MTLWLAGAWLAGLARAGGSDAPRIELGTDLAEAQALARATERPLLVFFGAVWCSNCRRFQRRTLPAPEVRALAGEFAWVYVEVDRNPGPTRAHDVRGTPTFVVLAPDGTPLARAAGALGPAEFAAFLRAARAPPGAAAASEDLAAHDAAPLTWTPQGYRAGSICFSHVGYGPLTLPSQAPAQVLRPNFRPRSPSTLAAGQLELVWSETFANIFSYRENDYRLDYLTLNSVLSLAYGLTDTLLLEVGFSDLSRFDSYLDPITNAFHDAFGLGDSGRDDFPERDNVLDLEPRDGVEIEDEDSGSESHNLTFALQHNLTCGSARLPAIAWALDASYHLGGHAELEGRSPLGLGLSAALARRLGDSVYAYLSFGHVWHGLDESRGLALEEEQWSALAACEWRYAADASWVLQYLVSEGVAEDRDPFDDASHEVNLGWKKELATGLVLELGLIENVIEADNSPDFGLHFALRRRF